MVTTWPDPSPLDGWWEAVMFGPEPIPSSDPEELDHAEGDS